MSATQSAQMQTIRIEIGASLTPQEANAAREEVVAEITQNLASSAIKFNQNKNTSKLYKAALRQPQV